MVDLSKRLKALADMVTPGSTVADVGCDHGYVSIYLVQREISPKVYAMDINEGPLLRAKEHIEEFNLQKYIETRLSNGLEALEVGEASALICAGMGGKLMQKILTEGRDKVDSMQELILQPQSELEAFRKYLREEGYITIDENMIFEDGKYYPMMKVSKSAGVKEKAVELQRLEDKFGSLLLKKKHPVLISYLKQSLQTYETIKQNLSKNGNWGTEEGREAIEKRLEDITKDMDDMQLALSMVEDI